MKKIKLKNITCILLLLITGLFIASCAQKSNKPVDTTIAVGPPCQFSLPKIGIYENANNNIFLLKNFYTFNIKNIDLNEDEDTSIDIIKDDMINIDKYQEIVNEYIQNGNRLSKTPEDDWAPNEIHFYPRLSGHFDNVVMQEGDIILNGPPLDFCGYGFIGIYSSDGKLKYAMINDAYKDYYFDGLTIKVEPGKPIACYGNESICEVQVDYRINDETFTLGTNEEYSPKDKPIKLVNSVYATVGKDGELIRNMDIKNGPKRNVDVGKYVSYTLHFVEKPAKV